MASVVEPCETPAKRMWSIKVRHHSTNYEAAKANCTHCYHLTLLPGTVLHTGSFSLMVYRNTLLLLIQTAGHLTQLLCNPHPVNYYTWKNIPMCKCFCLYGQTILKSLTNVYCTFYTDILRLVSFSIYISMLLEYTNIYYEDYFVFFSCLWSVSVQYKDKFWLCC